MMRFAARSDEPVVRRESGDVTDASLLAAEDADAFALLYDRHVRRVSTGREHGRASMPPI
jgi:hypothetical protein